MGRWQRHAPMATRRPSSTTRTAASAGGAWTRSSPGTAPAALRPRADPERGGRSASWPACPRGSLARFLAPGRRRRARCARRAMPPRRPWRRSCSRAGGRSAVHVLQALPRASTEPRLPRWWRGEPRPASHALLRIDASCQVRRSGLRAPARVHKIKSRGRSPKPKPVDGELFLIDGNSLAYRAFFALPESIATADGRPTNAIYGFASMMAKLLIDYRPGTVIVAWDAGMSGREKEYPEYKAGAQVAARPAPGAVAAPGAAGRGVRLRQRQGRGLRGRRRDRHAGAHARARPGHAGDDRLRRPRRLPAGRATGSG